ncbi:hypothetical protein DRE_07243 [Drechslerella stenobrocha 248]|uniref:Uncharacterized protein n=1 Tax=Drechslerella stenobrocha 248 TaxID=1043628 RepID=W7HIV9_9PEZI|nr:hypothetical protein DRE_07243 [Drechslerella stenobrocha 248]
MSSGLYLPSPLGGGGAAGGAAGGAPGGGSGGGGAPGGAAPGGAGSGDNQGSPGDGSGRSGYDPVKRRARYEAGALAAHNLLREQGALTVQIVFQLTTPPRPEDVIWKQRMDPPPRTGGSYYWRQSDSYPNWNAEGDPYTAAWNKTLNNPKSSERAVSRWADGSTRMLTRMVAEGVVVPELYADNSGTAPVTPSSSQTGPTLGLMAPPPVPSNNLGNLGVFQGYISDAQFMQSFDPTFNPQLQMQSGAPVAPTPGALTWYPDGSEQNVNMAPGPPEPFNDQELDELTQTIAQDLGLPPGSESDNMQYLQQFEQHMPTYQHAPTYHPPQNSQGGQQRQYGLHGYIPPNPQGQPQYYSYNTGGNQGGYSGTGQGGNGQY